MQFKRRMNGDTDGVEVIFDDIIIAAKDELEHDTIMRKLLLGARVHHPRPR